MQDSFGGLSTDPREVCRPEPPFDCNNVLISDDHLAFKSYSENPGSNSLLETELRRDTDFAELDSQQVHLMIGVREKYSE